MRNRNASGEVVGLLGVARDIADRTRAMERMAQLDALAASLSDVTTTEAVARATLHHGHVRSERPPARAVDDGVSVEMAGIFGYSDESVARW
jgi:hypothetical protein